MHKKGQCCVACDGARDQNSDFGKGEQQQPCDRTDLALTEKVVVVEEREDELATARLNYILRAHECHVLQTTNTVIKVKICACFSPLFRR